MRSSTMDPARVRELERGAGNLRAQSHQIAFHLRTLFGDDLFFAALEVLFIRVDGFAIPLELQGAKTDVAEDLPAPDDLVSPTKLDDRFFVLRAIRILQKNDPRREGALAFVGVGRSISVDQPRGEHESKERTMGTPSHPYRIG